MTATRTAAALIRASRPKQWLKNSLVLAAPLAAGKLLSDSVAAPVVAAMVAFTLAASGIYLVNDVRDAEADRLHPLKRSRPVASGDLSPRLATTAGAVALLAGVGLATVVTPLLGLTVGLYAIAQLAYAYGLKHEPVIDLATVASGFLLRAVAGGVAAGVPLSKWFLIVTAFGALFVVAGKRYSELRALGAAAGTRRSLVAYSESYLRFVWSLAAAVTVTAYALWAFEISSTGSALDWQAISIAPLVLAVLRYAVDVDRGLAGEPEDAILRDRVLLVLVGTWLVVFTLGVYSV